VGLYLKNNVFSHGQLYVAFSRVSDPKNITIYLDQKEKKHGWFNSCAYTKNVVYTGLIQNEIEKFKNNPDFGEGPLEFADGNFVLKTIV